jgi:hypothetical protein
MLQKIKKFSKLSMEEKSLFIEAYCILGMIRMAILKIPIKQLICSLGYETVKEEPTDFSRAEEKTAFSIGKAVEQAAANTLWESTCLAQSLAAQKMLHRRKIFGIIVIGIEKSEESGQIKAHAWSKYGETIITGKNGYERFTILSIFGKNGM